MIHMRSYRKAVLPVLIGVTGLAGGCVVTQHSTGGTRERQIVIGWPLTITYTDRTLSNEFDTRDEITSSLTENLEASNADTVPPPPPSE